MITGFTLNIRQRYLRQNKVRGRAQQKKKILAKFKINY